MLHPGTLGAHGVPQYWLHLQERQAAVATSLRAQLVHLAREVHGLLQDAGESAAADALLAQARQLASMTAGFVLHAAVRLAPCTLDIQPVLPGLTAAQPSMTAVLSICWLCTSWRAAADL